MGIFASKIMDQNLKKQQEFMLHNARIQVEKKMYTVYNKINITFIFYLRIRNLSKGTSQAMDEDRYYSSEG